MNLKQALAIIKPEDNTKEALKQAYRKAAIKHHPDHGGDPEIMKIVNSAYDLLQEYFHKWSMTDAEEAANDVPLTETLSKLWDRIKTFPGIKGELIGTWLWVTGDTYTHREVLKELKFKFSRKKSAWYYHEGTFFKRQKKDMDLDQIRSKYGSADLDKKELNKIAA